MRFTPRQPSEFLRLGRDSILMFSVTLLLLGLIEGSLRMAGYPHGTFVALDLADGLYPPNKTFVANWGPIPYLVRSNSLGLRGPEIEAKKPAGTFRIATIGDSVTDGFFVDNEAMWQPALQTELSKKSLRRVEVISCARGGGSISRELAALKECALPLSADLVVLTFVTNDLFEISSVPNEQLLSYNLKSSGVSRAFQLLVYRTAVGEVLLKTFLRVRSSSYRAKLNSAPALSNDRYRIEGGDRFRENAARFAESFNATDGLALQTVFEGRSQELLSKYFSALSVLVDTAQKKNVEVLFVYFPAYSQIYGGAPTAINQRFKEWAGERDIGYLDLTPAFQRAGGQILHLAPLDFHLNPDGNRLFAVELSNYLTTYQRGLTGKKD